MMGGGFRLFPPAGKSGDFRYPPYMRLLFNQGHHRRFARIHIADIFRQHAGKLYPLPHPLWKVAESGGDFAGRFINPIRNKGFEHIIAVHPGAGAEIRRWGDEKYIDLITILSRKISPAFILIGTDRTENTAIIKSLPKNIEILDLSGQTTIAELAGVLASSDLFIGADSGPLQLAAAAGTRTLGLFFASAQVHETGPLGDGHIVIQAYPYCAPCREDEPACGNEITCRNMIPPGFAAETALSILEDDVDRISEIEIPKDVLLCKSRYDESGQTYDVLNEGWYDSAGFYRGLWTELLSGNGKTGYKPSSRMNSVKFERLISELAKDPLTLPLANHYLMVKADEGEAEAERQITTAVEYIKNIPV
ncbi:MAG: glycosyltransferase family 9 protein [FCB group bacterium]|nr:glycosyltransferase family 9 protein [FCB group bacterium]